MTEVTISGAAAEPAKFRGEAPEILHVIDNLKVGGAQSLLITMSMPGTTRLGMRVIDLNGHDTAVAARLSSSGVPVERVGVRRLSSPSGWARLYRRLREAPERVVHLHLGYATIMASPLSKLLHKKVVVTLHNIDRPSRPGLSGSLVRRLETFCLRHFVDHVVAVGNEVLRTNRHRLGTTRADTLLNVIAPPAQASSFSRPRKRRELGAAAADIVILSLGRLNPQKDHLILLSAFAQVRSDCPRAVLWIAGDGALRPRLEEAAEVLGISDSVSFLGPRSDVPELIAAADIFALSSAWEGLPVALVEAMACGLAPVATAVGDVPQLIADRRNGLLVEPQNPRKLADALLELCRDSALRASFGRHAKASVKRLTDLDGWRRALAAIYEQINRN